MERTGGYPASRSAGEHVAFYGALARDESIEFLHYDYVAYEYWIRANGNSSSNRDEHRTAKGELLSIEARKRGYTDWHFSGIVLRNAFEPAIYIPQEGQFLRTPKWIEADAAKARWTWRENVVK